LSKLKEIKLAPSNAVTRNFVRPLTLLAAADAAPRLPGTHCNRSGPELKLRSGLASAISGQIGADSLSCCHLSQDTARPSTTPPIDGSYVPIAVVSGLLNSKKLLRCTFGDNLERRPKCWIGVLRVGGIVHVRQLCASVPLVV